MFKKILFIYVFFVLVFSCNSTDWSTHSRYPDKGSFNLVNCPYPYPPTDDFAFVVVWTRICDQRASSETSLRSRLPTNFTSALSGKKISTRIHDRFYMLKYFSIHCKRKKLLALLLRNFYKPYSFATRAYITVKLPAKNVNISSSIT